MGVRVGEALGSIGMRVGKRVGPMGVGVCKAIKVGTVAGVLTTGLTIGLLVAICLPIGSRRMVPQAARNGQGRSRYIVVPQTSPPSHISGAQKIVALAALRLPKFQDAIRYKLHKDHPTQSAVHQNERKPISVCIGVVDLGQDLPHFPGNAPD